MKSIIIILVCVFWGINSFAQTESDAVFEKIVKEYTVNKDGSLDFHYYKKLKYLTHFSFNRLYGETFIVYNPNHQQLKINFAKTTQSNGGVVHSPPNAYNEVLPKFAADAPYYNNLREMVITHAGLELGAVVELDYTLHSDSGYYSALMLDEILSEDAPVTEKEIIIKIPNELNLFYNVLNLRTGPDISFDGTHKVYRYHFSGIPENSHEAHQPNDNSHLPRLICSTVNWREAQSIISQQIQQPFELSDNIKVEIEKIINKHQDKTEQILELQQLVSNQINTYKTPLVYIGYRIRTPQEVWNCDGGTFLEKTLLLTELIKDAGFSANPLAVIPAALVRDSIGCLNLISEYVVQVNLDEEEKMYISPISSSSQNLFYTLNNKILLQLNTKNDLIEIKENFTNKVIMNGELSIDDSLKLVGYIKSSFFERLNPNYSLMEDKTKAKSILGGGITTVDIDTLEILNTTQNNSNIKYTIEAKQSIPNHSDYYFFKLPINNNGSNSWHINYLLPSRVDPFEIPFPVNEQYSFTITLPHDVMLINPAELIELKEDFGEIKISISQKSNKIVVTRMLVVSSQQISSESYDRFKALLDLWNENKYRELVLKKKNKG